VYQNITTKWNYRPNKWNTKNRFLSKHISPEKTWAKMHSENSEEIENWKQTQIHYTKRSPKLRKTKNSALHVLELPPFCTKYYLLRLKHFVKCMRLLTTQYVFDCQMEIKHLVFSVQISLTYWKDDQGISILFPAWGTNFLLFQSVQTHSGAHQ
jgi:hypothetical protein